MSVSHASLAQQLSSKSSSDYEHIFRRRIGQEKKYHLIPSGPRHRYHMHHMYHLIQKQNVHCSTLNIYIHKKHVFSLYYISTEKVQSLIMGEKEEIWLSPMTKAPTTTEMSKGQSDNTNNATKKFDYIAVADQLRTVSWSNYSHPTGVVNLVYGPNFPTPRNSRVIKRTHV